VKDATQRRERRILAGDRTGGVPPWQLLTDLMAEENQRGEKGYSQGALLKGGLNGREPLSRNTKGWGEKKTQPKENSAELWGEESCTEGQRHVTMGMTKE